MYQLVVLDIDGTLSSPTTPLSDFTRDTILSLVEKGIQIALVTGKQYNIIAPIIQDLHLSAPQVTAHGAIITDPSTGKTVYQKRVPRHQTETVIQIAEERQLTLVIARDGKTFVRESNKDVEYMLSFGDPFPTFCPDLRSALSRLPSHLMMIAYGEQEKFDLAEKALTGALGKELQITRSSPFYLDLMHRHVSKGRAVHKLAALLGIQREEILAIGDGENDISMFQAAGLSIAMGNSSERVKAVASAVTEECQENGAANALARIFQL